MKKMQTVVKWFLGAALAGAFLVSTPQAAKAQVAVGVEIGHPVAVTGLYAPARYENDWRRREYFEHRRWEREQWERFHRYGDWDRRGWRAHPYNR